jgi:hypothetical protein
MLQVGAAGINQTNPDRIALNAKFSEWWIGKEAVAAHFRVIP